MKDAQGDLVLNGRTQGSPVRYWEEDGIMGIVERTSCWFLVLVPLGSWFSSTLFFVLLFSVLLFSVRRFRIYSEVTS